MPERRARLPYDVIEAIVSRDPAQYRNVDDGRDVALLDGLLDSLLMR